jgi:hypothetical protein
MSGAGTPACRGGTPAAANLHQASWRRHSCQIGTVGRRKRLPHGTRARCAETSLGTMLRRQECRRGRQQCLRHA